MVKSDWQDMTPRQPHVWYEKGDPLTLTSPQTATEYEGAKYGGGEF